MQRSHIIKVQQHSHQLGWFVVLSVLAHGIFLVIPVNKQDTNLHVNLYSTLQVTVTSSRSVGNPVQDSDVDKISSKSQYKEDTAVFPVKRDIKIAAARVRGTSNPEPDNRRIDEKKIAHSATNSSTRSAKSESLIDSPDSLVTPVSKLNVPLNHLRQRLKEMVRARFTYPRMARRMGWEGLVGLSLHIEDDGSLNQVRVAHSSGHKLLDDNARKTIQSIGRIQVASNLAIQAADTEIEVLYRLTD